MNYQITSLCPRSDLALGGWGFGIKLFPEFRKAVEVSKLTQDKACKAIENMGRFWLDDCGFNAIFDYDGEKTHLYKPNQELRVTWGEWGLEHITVPGNACGLDIDNGISAPIDGRVLQPHNVDSMQKLCC